MDYPNIVVYFIYLGFLLSALTVPLYATPRFSFSFSKNRINVIFSVLAVFVSVFVLTGSGTLPSVSAAILSLAFLPIFLAGDPWKILASVAALLLFSKVNWWAPHQELGIPQSILFLVLAGLASALAYLVRRGEGLPGPSVVLAAAGVGVAANCFSGPLLSPMGLGAMWHHWSVYLAPAQIFTTGAVPFNDFPIQYGLGPMTLMAAGCLGECWSGAYVVVALSNVALLLSMMVTAVLLLRNTSRGPATCAAIALLSSVVLWTTFPPDVIGVLATPSTGGIRFIPLSLIVLFITTKEILRFKGTWVGHALWAMGVIWSPEAGFFVTLVWWPYLALLDIEKHSVESLWPVTKTLVLRAVHAICALVTIVMVFSTLFKVYYGEWPSLSGYLAYIFNPPGRLPVNIYGPVWLIVLTVVIGFISIFRTTGSDRRIVAVGLLALLAVSSYYLSRSHDNNVLNLLPFVVLVLITALRLNVAAAVQGFTKAVLVGIIAWPAAFGFQQWSTAWESGVATTVGMTKVFDRMDVASPASWEAVDLTAVAMKASVPPTAEAGQAFASLLQTGDGMPLLLNGMLTLPRSGAAPPWTTLTNSANYIPLPASVIEMYIRKGAERYRRAGWILIDRNNPGAWLDLFKTAYTVSEQRTFGGYDGYRLVPR